MTDVPTDPVAQALPCNCGIDDFREPQPAELHEEDCPARHRPAVTDLLADRDKRIAELEAVLALALDCLLVGDPEREHLSTQRAIAQARAALEKRS